MTKQVTLSKAEIKDQISMCNEIIYHRSNYYTQKDKEYYIAKKKELEAQL